MSDLQRANILIETVARNSKLKSDTTTNDIDKITALIDSAFESVSDNDYKKIATYSDYYISTFTLHTTYPHALDRVKDRILPALNGDSALQYEIAMRTSMMYHGIAKYFTQRQHDFSVDESISLASHYIASAVYVANNYMPDVSNKADSINRRYSYKAEHAYFRNIALYFNSITLYHALDSYSREQDKLTLSESLRYRAAAMHTYLNIATLMPNSDISSNDWANFLLVSIYDLAWLLGLDNTVENIVERLPNTQVKFEDESFNANYKAMAYNVLERSIRATTGDTHADKFTEQYKNKYKAMTDAELKHYLPLKDL